VFLFEKVAQNGLGWAFWGGAPETADDSGMKPGNGREELVKAPLSSKQRAFTAEVAENDRSDRREILCALS